MSNLVMWRPTKDDRANEWSVQQVLVTPAMAVEWLKSNVGNRSLRKPVVKRYALMMRAGNWILTPDGVIFDSNGILIQGQHRLTAIVESETPVWMIVWRNVDPGVFRTLDRGVTRNYADALKIDRKLAECARLAATLCGGHQNVMDDDVQYMAEFIGKEYEELIEYCPSRQKIFASAPYRLAATIRIMCGDGEYAKHMYRSLVLSHIADLPPSGQWAIKQAITGKIRTGGYANAQENMLLAWRLFDPENRDLNFIRLTSEKTIAELRAIICPNGTRGKP